MLRKEFAEDGGGSKFGLNEKEGEDVPSGQSLKSRLVGMARKALQMEISSDKLDQLLERQDWLDEMKRESQKNSSIQLSISNALKYSTDQGDQI